MWPRGIAALLLVLAWSVAAGEPRYPNNWPEVAPEARLWNTYPMDQVTFKPWTGPAKPLEAVRIVAPIGGTSTGQLVATQGGAVKGLSIKVTPPQGWPADSVTARFQTLADATLPNMNWGPGHYLPVLTDTAPAHPVVPIRIIATVPRTATAGTAEAKITVTFDGKTETVPIKIECGPFVMPEKGQWASRFDITHSLEQMAVRYKAPLWSDAHWTLVESSLKLMSQYGTRTTWIPLIANALVTGQTESILRYEKTSSGWRVDASRLEKYLELYDRHLGAPTSLACVVWSGIRRKADEGSVDVHAKRGTEADLPKCTMMVTGMDGKPITVKVFSPDGTALYTAAFEAVRAAVKKRGWPQECVHIGLAMDPVPSKFFVDALKGPSGNAPWVRHAHDQARDFYGVPVAYCGTARMQADWGGNFWENPRMMVSYRYEEGPDQGLARTYAQPGHAFASKLRGMTGPMADYWGGTDTMLWIGGQPTMRQFGPYIFQPGPKGSEHTVASLILLQAAQAGEAAFRIARSGGSASRWINWAAGHQSRAGGRYKWAAHEANLKPMEIPDMEAELFRHAAGK